MADTNAEALARLLPPHALLSSCGSAELADLLSGGTMQSRRKGDTLLRQGDRGDTLLILVAGTARISMVASNGREIILDYAEPGTVLGEIAVLDGGERTASVVATQDVQVLTLTAVAFEAFVARHPAMAWRLLREMARRLRQANSTIESDRAFASGPRLARFLQRLAQDDGTSALRLELSQTELSLFAGISRENINRQLAAWADAGVIALDQGRVRILDHETLSEIAAAAE
jgi:CRP/FNR family cyclic AMP-dependent transcriptional regulator